jgi:1-acyl-sn-glycerol-3-phosphate acyltransferase
MADEHRTSLAGRPVPAEDAGESGAPDQLPERRPAELMRELLPAIEPERRLNDWGRSERVEGFMDRTLVEFFYRYWFRVEVEGIENVPADSGGLLVSNHAGALPPDAPMIAKAIREEHPSPRPVYITVEHFFKGYPGFSMLIPKTGCVAAHPANVHRLLYDERELVLVFPEGTEKLYRDRYRLRRFGRGGFVEAAMRAEAQLIPTCVVGAEESAPIFGHMDAMKKLTGLLYFPITPTFPWFGLAGMLGYLPAKFKIRFLEPIDTVELGGAEAAEDKALVQTLAQEIRAQIQENLHEMLAQRKSVWLG